MTIGIIICFTILSFNYLKDQYLIYFTAGNSFESNAGFVEFRSNTTSISNFYKELIFIIKNQSINFNL